MTATCATCAGGWQGRHPVLCQTEASPRFWHWQRKGDTCKYHIDRPQGPREGRGDVSACGDGDGAATAAASQDCGCRMSDLSGLLVVLPALPSGRADPCRLQRPRLPAARVSVPERGRVPVHVGAAAGS